MSRLIQLVDLSLYCSKKICFEAFNYSIYSGERIALIGDNGSGKSCMLKIIKNLMPPNEGYVHYADNLTVSYVPQLINGHDTASGAERFNWALTQALAEDPDVLLLDEPTNHLDTKNRQSLMRLLAQYTGTLIIASHDIHLLRSAEYCFWHFNQSQITLFKGHFDHFQQQNTLNRQVIETEIGQLRYQKKQQHQALMKEQIRAKNSRLKGEKSIDQAKWPTIVSKSKVLRAQETSGKKKKNLAKNKEDLINRLHELGKEEEINPHFDLSLSHSTTKALVTISDGSVSYNQRKILNNINLNITGQSRVALCGVNGSGKSTLIKAIMGSKEIIKEGLWLTPGLKDIGYLDQHYQQLSPDDTVLETLQNCREDWSHVELRKHLNDFLFRTNEEVNAPTLTLSGGEKARLCLAKIAANPPKLLLLDELTNNMDLKTRSHVMTLMQKYPGPFIVISHDDDFLEQININEYYNI
ncbi:ATP-binding cassette domain-containing protein [Legionella bononiensis]|uniref:ABC-F family ATP-binding cassette domain-containing protein n=1 Tax=Legionella bononiensis TaxID=2793102 RepID=A0ABS1WE41_9GAMM|nr:ATP-binding cassette domain-containing protein [Legionella bononiensis]MBL7479514.1 ABC-F family ATP-binding cassette domain-containing protein [Legionella bononiensis]MBL7527612.1 ABC-F family ATP-binding cassette domain-containing protein [Legionella bononiensis]